MSIVSKAFDRVHYGTLFRVLLTKCVPMCFIRLVLDSYIRQKACELRFKTVSEEKIMKLLTGLNSCKATGLDGLPAKFIIDNAESIVKPLTYIVNLSIESGVFPDDLKRAKIVPIYKKKAKTKPDNYRPVSPFGLEYYV